MGNFPKFTPKIQSCPFCLKIGSHSILEVLIPNPGLELRNSDPKTLFGQIWTENSKLSVLPENWHSWYIGGADSKSRLRTSKFRSQNSFLGKFGPKIQSCPFCLKIGTHGILKVLIRNLGIEFRNSEAKVLFWANLGCKFKVVCFAWKLALMVYWRCWFCIRTQFFKIPTPKSTFGPIWAEKPNLSVLPENWHTEYFEVADSYSYISFHFLASLG